MPELSEEHTLGSSAGGKWTLAEDEVLGGYRVIRPLGRGGMGEVYLVEHIEMGKRYALKVLSPEHSRDPEFRDRFRVEARVMADLEHPGIVRVHNMGEERDRFFLVMDYIEASSGEPVTLDALMRKRKLRENEARSLAAGIARALDYAHTFGEGVVHRDLKPGNVLLTADGRVRVSDFGLAKVLGEEYLKSVLEKSVSLSVSAARTVAGEKGASPGLTQSDGAVLGTFEYMAPEQKEGRADARSDIYSLGLMIYRMLTGRRAEGRFPDPSKLGLAEWWDRVIEKSLAPDPDERYASVAEILADLQRAEPEKKAMPTPKRPRFSRAMRAVVVALGATLAVGLALGIISWFGVQPPPPPPPRDLPPEVRFTRAPEGDVAAPSATLMFEIEASDDEGLKEVGMVCVVRGRPRRTVLSRPSGGTRRTKVKHALKLASLGLRGGETVTYYAYARDDDAVGGPKEAQSRARRVKIISPVAGDEAAWLAVKREAETMAARGDYAGALDAIRRYLDSAATVKFKPQAVFLWGKIEQEKVEEEKRRKQPVKERRQEKGPRPPGQRSLPRRQEEQGPDEREVLEKPARKGRYEWEKRGWIGLEGHGGPVLSVAFSGDGRYLATGSKDREAALWEVSTGGMLRTLTGHRAGVLSVSFSPDGRYLATGSDDRLAALWDPQTGALLRMLRGHEADVYSVDFSPDGRLLATGSDGNTAALWAVSTGRRLRTFGGHRSDVKAVAFSPDGRLLATGSNDDTAALWGVSTGMRIRTLEGHSGDVRSVDFSPDGRFLATGSDDDAAALWEVSAGRRLRSFRGHRSDVKSVAFSPDGRFLATGSHDDTARLWEVSTGRSLMWIEGHRSDVNAVAFSPDGRLLATGSADGTARMSVLPEELWPKGR